MDNRLVFGDGKFSVANAVQDGVPILIFEPMDKPIEVGNRTHRKVDTSISVEELSKAYVLEFHKKESVLVVLEQLMAVYFSCLDTERQGGENE